MITAYRGCSNCRHNGCCEHGCGGLYWKPEKPDDMDGDEDESSEDETATEGK